MDVLAWLLFIALIVAAVLIYMRVAKRDIWNRWKNKKHLPYEGVVTPIKRNLHLGSAQKQSIETDFIP
jgi:hypothetical protein